MVTGERSMFLRWKETFVMPLDDDSNSWHGHYITVRHRNIQLKKAMSEVLRAWIWETHCELLPRGAGWKQSAQQLGGGRGRCGGVGGVCVCIRSLTANLREPKSLYLSPPESAKGLRTGGRRAARFNQPATRLASNPDLQICKHRSRTSWFVQSSVKFRARRVFWCIGKSRKRLERQMADGMRGAKRCLYGKRIEKNNNNRMHYESFCYRLIQMALFH